MFDFAYCFNTEQPFLRRFRDQVPNLTFKLSIGTQINAHDDLRLGNITQSTNTSRVNFRIGAEKQPRQHRLKVSTLPMSSSERPKICQIRVAHPVHEGALNASHGHPGPRQKSPFAIARTSGANGGKIGGKIIFFRAVNTVLEPSRNVFWRP